MTKYRPKKTKTEESIVRAYKQMEESIVKSYFTMEHAVVRTYQKIEDKFVERFLEEVNDESEDVDAV